MTDVFVAPGVHWTPVSWQLRVMRRILWLWVTAGLLWLLLWLPDVFSSYDGLDDLARRLAVVVLLVGLIGWVVIGRASRSWGYAERDEDLYIKRGTLFRQVIAVPYGRMQFVEVTAGPVEQLFGLASIRLNTASPRSRARITGLTPREAARLRDRLTELGQIHAAGL